MLASRLSDEGCRHVFTLNPNHTQGPVSPRLGLSRRCMTSSPATGETVESTSCSRLSTLDLVLEQATRKLTVQQVW